MVASQAATHQKLDVFGTPLAVYTSGSGEPAVVFISGLGDSGNVWRPVVKRMEGPNTLLSYDRAGCGLSDDLTVAEAAEPRAASWAARQLHELLSLALANKRVVLVGHSVGGQIADAFAIRWPETVAGLVLVDAVDPELNLHTSPPRPVLDDAVPSRAGHGWKWDVAASAAEYSTTAPTQRPPAVVIGSAIWRWFRAKQPELYRPLSLVEVDQRWQLAQLRYALRWNGALVIAHEAGHRLHEEAPALLARSISAVVEAASSGKSLRLDATQIRQAGGSVRPTSAAS
jgi:pimeloyl-ACP methyl ester carboxylesterase